ncbi:hypothetical protein ACWDOP_30675 [Nocardia sp. NPDC003693]
MSNPYGQPYPGSYGYQQPGYQQPAYPPPGYQPGYPMYPQLPPSGATAITAGVIALIVGIIAGIGGVVMVGAAAALSSEREKYGRSSANDLESLLIGMGVLVILIGAFWFIGALLLFARKTAGRVMLIIASGLGLLGGLGQLTLGEYSGPIFGLGISLLILILCLVPATGRWIAAGKRPVPPAGYAPYPYY